MRQKGTKVTGMVALLTTAVILMTFASTPLTARISNNLTAEMRLGYSLSEQDSASQENVDQEYVLNWQKRILRDLSSSASLRYFNFGGSETVGANSWRSEFQPSAEIHWNGRGLSASLQGIRRDTKSNDQSSRLISESTGMSITSQMVGYPWIRARAQQDLLYNKANLADRDTRDRSAGAGVGYSTKSTSVNYSYSYRTTLDRAQQVEQSNNAHEVRFDHSSLFYEGKIRSTVSYGLTYRRDSDRNLAFDPFPREIPLFLGLYSSDATPDIGTLDTVNTLIDGNRTLPAIPLIDIGDNKVNQNIGADLGYLREVEVLYVYTDKPSGNNVRWDVYRSGDNTIWEAVAGATSTYSPGFSRYEISFPQVQARYIKALNKGLNENDTVYVTEFTAMVRVNESGTMSRNQTIQTANLTNNFQLSQRWSALAGISLRRDAGGLSNRGRDETHYLLNLNNQLTGHITHSARLQLGFIGFESSHVDVDKIFSSDYSIQYKPLQTLEFSLSLIHRDNYIGQMKSQEINYGLARIRGTLLPRLETMQELSGGRNTSMSGNTGFDSWSYRSNLIGRVTSKLEMTAGYFHQRIRDLNGFERSKNQYDFSFGYLVTSSIQTRGNLNLTKDGQTRYFNQDYSISWVLSPKISTSGTVSITEYQNGTSSRSERYSAQVEYSLSRRTFLSGSYSENDLPASSGISGRSVRVGLRTGL